jgi:excisionase family DNA binding protein
MPEYITVKQAAELMGLHPHTVYKLIHLGKLPAYKLGPKLIRLKQTDVQEHLQKEVI